MEKIKPPLLQGGSRQTPDILTAGVLLPYAEAGAIVTDEMLNISWTQIKYLTERVVKAMEKRRMYLLSALHKAPRCFIRLSYLWKVKP